MPQQSHLMSWLGQPLADLKAVLTKLHLILIAPIYACPLSVISPEVTYRCCEGTCGAVASPCP